MRTSVYALYLSTFERARAALACGDEAGLRALCADASRRDGVESTVSLLAMSDAERGALPRRRSAMLWLVRGAVHRREGAGVARST